MNPDPGHQGSSNGSAAPDGSGVPPVTVVGGGWVAVVGDGWAGAEVLGGDVGAPVVGGG
jgi:hypothetical protein